MMRRREEDEEEGPAPAPAPTPTAPRWRPHACLPTCLCPLACLCLPWLPACLQEAQTAAGGPKTDEEGARPLGQHFSMCVYMCRRPQGHTIRGGTLMYV